MCWLDWVAGCLDIWSYIILVCLWTCWIFLDKFNIWNSRLRKKDCILTMLVGFVQSVEDLNKTTGLPTSKRKFLLPNCPGIGHQFFFCLWSETWILALPVSWDCRPLDLNFTTRSSGALVYQLQILIPSASVIMWTNSLW